MAVQSSVAARDAALDARWVAIGASPIMEIRTGSQPANCAAASTGTLLVQATLPASPMAAASGGTKAKSGTWQDLLANGSGNAGYYRIFDSTGTTCHKQGSCSATGGGGDLELSAAGVPTVAVIAGSPVTVTSFTETEGNA